MNTSVYNPAIQQTLRDSKRAFRNQLTKKVIENGEEKSVPYPYPSPTDWRDNWIYFLIIDRFNNVGEPPASQHKVPSVSWDQRYNYRQGGTFKGVQAQLEYIASLGAGAIWLSPILKNPKPDLEYSYHGYAAQDFLTVDGRFGSDGTAHTAEKEFIELVEAAHAKGLYVILDIVINHAARVFDYDYKGAVVESFSDPGILNGPLGDEPPVQWLNGLGIPRGDWENQLPPAPNLSPDDAVWPEDFQRIDFFRRRGNKLSDVAPPGGFAKGDFGTLRQLVVEYDAQSLDKEPLRKIYGKTPVLNILITAYNYLIAKFDIDGFRIDTVKYVEPSMVETFGNAIREYALSIGKKNFFTFGEIYDDESTIERFVGRNSSNTEGFGIDAALDYPLFFTLPAVVKAELDVAALRQVFSRRKEVEKGLLSSHGEAGKYFVTFLDNHDQHQRFNHPLTPRLQVLQGLAALFCLQGIPCIYYGTEQGLQGAIDQAGNPDLGSLESVREALWGKQPIAFDKQNPIYKDIEILGNLRKSEPALRYGRLYFREISANCKDFGHSEGIGGILAFSRVLAEVEVLLVANTNPREPFEGYVIVDIDINRNAPPIKVAYSNMGTTGQGAAGIIDQATFYDGETKIGKGEAAALFVKLAPMEVQILVPA